MMGKAMLRPRIVGLWSPEISTILREPLEASLIALRRALQMREMGLRYVSVVGY